MSAGLKFMCFTFSQLNQSIRGNLPIVPDGDTGTIPYSILQHAEDFVGTAFDTREGAGGGISTREPWAGHGERAENEEIQPSTTKML